MAFLAAAPLLAEATPALLAEGANVAGAGLGVANMLFGKKKKKSSGTIRYDIKAKKEGTKKKGFGHLTKKVGKTAYKAVTALGSEGFLKGAQAATKGLDVALNVIGDVTGKKDITEGISGLAHKGLGAIKHTHQLYEKYNDKNSSDIMGLSKSVKPQFIIEDDEQTQPSNIQLTKPITQSYAPYVPYSRPTNSSNKYVLPYQPPTVPKKQYAYSGQDGEMMYAKPRVTRESKQISELPKAKYNIIFE